MGVHSNTETKRPFRAFLGRDCGTLQASSNIWDVFEGIYLIPEYRGSKEDEAGKTARLDVEISVALAEGGAQRDLCHLVVTMNAIPQRALYKSIEVKGMAG